MTAAGRRADDPPPRSPGLLPRFDAVTFLTIYLLLLCAIPSFLTIPALGSLGRPSTVWGLAGFLWWLFHRLQAADDVCTGSPRIRAGIAAVGGAVLLSYGVNVLQGIPPQEVTVADSGILRMCSWLGIALVALDGVRTRDQLRTLVHRIAVLGVAMAALGLVQFVTGDPVVDRLSLPGFVVSGEFASVQTRAGFSRAAGTAAHPLEYAVVLSATLPLAIAAVLPRFARRPLRSLIPPVAIVAALMVSVSRSALIGLAVGVLLILPSLPPRARIMAMLSGAGVTVAIAFTVPGMLGTIRGLVFGALNDPSTKSRSASLLPALHIASRDLLVGRGFGTFLPNNLILDNQFLLVLIELGLLGLFALGLVVLAAMVEGFRPLRCRNDPEARLIGAALAAGIGANVTLLFFFDGLAFIMPGGFLFLYIGLAGTLSALPASDTAIPPQAAAPAQR